MNWRYQPVYIEDGDTKVFSLCEVYFDANDKLESWTENAFMHPQGDNMDDLRGDLTHMLSDAHTWMPVRFSDLKTGMIFQRAISQEDAEGIADISDAQGEIDIDAFDYLLIRKASAIARKDERIPIAALARFMKMDLMAADTDVVRRFIARYGRGYSFMMNETLRSFVRAEQRRQK